MKSPTLAFTLSFFLPGAGLCYLGKWLWGVGNLLAVIGIALVITILFGDVHQHMSTIAAGIAGGSGGLAMALARQQNEKLTNKAET